MASATPVRNQIFDGPAHYQFMIHGFCERNSVEFTLERNGKKVTCTLNAVEYEDGGGNRFIIGGFVHNQPVVTNFKGYYDLKLRTGWIEF